MILAVDVGNTNITIGCIDYNKKIHFISRLSTDINRSEDEYAIDFKNILELYHININQLDGSIIASVVPPLITVHKNALEKIIGIAPVIVDKQTKISFNIDLDKDIEIGADLIVGAAAALDEYKKPIIIFDLGTATTVSVINSNNTFIGGLILPGIKISLEALSNKTSQLPHIDLINPKKIIGKNSPDSMNSGIINGNAAMIDGLVERICEELHEEATVIVTGGLSNVVAPHCRKRVICDNDLLIKGLLIIYKNNIKNPTL